MAAQGAYFLRERAKSEGGTVKTVKQEFSMEQQGEGGRGSGSERGELIITPEAIVFSLSPEHRRQARECLRKSGEIRISFQEVSVTSLREIRELSEATVDPIVD
jgi:hypothetical protein